MTSIFMISPQPPTHLGPLPDLHDDLHRRGVLVVDDSSMHRYSTQLCLNAFGITQVFEAANGKLALDYFAAHFSHTQHPAQSQFSPPVPPPAVMILDLEMPVMDGIEVLQQLAGMAHKPAVILASSSDEVLISAVATMVEALGITLLGAFRKPISPADLANALIRYSQTQAQDAPDTQVQYPARVDVLTNRHGSFAKLGYADYRGVQVVGGGAQPGR
jgi:CheY-like chemotaxis protein